MAKPPFPYPPLPEGDLSLAPRGGLGRQDAIHRDACIVRWFIVKRWERTVRGASPLGEILSVAEHFDETAETSPIVSIEPAQRDYLLYVISALSRVAWGIRALHGNAKVKCQVDATFIDDELQGTDSKEVRHSRKLPAGIGTLFFAARLVQAGRGGRIRISGHGGVGHDIRYETPQGGLMLVERKDRSYEPGLNDSDADRAQRVVNETNTSGRKIPTEEKGAARILVVGFHDLVYPHEVDELANLYITALREGLRHGPFNDLPDCVIVEHFGIEGMAGGQKNNYWCPIPLTTRQEFLRVWPTIWKALGGQGEATTISPYPANERL